MVTKLMSMSFIGIKTIPIEIEVDIQTKVSEFEVVGLAGPAVKESVKRIETAIQNSGFHFPGKRIIVNLAPAGIKKVGSLFDLPIALGILNEALDFQNLDNCVITGELSLDGKIRPIPGALPIALKAREMGYKRILCPSGSAAEMSIIDGIDIIPLHNLKDASDYLSGLTDISPSQQTIITDSSNKILYSLDMADIKGQESAKRALEISAAGGHNALMVGPPGTGKTMLAKRIPSILPPMSISEALETTMIYSVAGIIDPKKPLLMERPFRTPHHTASDASIIGGGKFPRPGEVSLAHNGVLFMDEFQQFKSNVLQVMRQPLEDSKITISRVEGSVEFPANFMLIAALNPSRRNSDIDQWDVKEMKSIMNKLSGPLLDRIDIQIQVSRIKYDQLRSKISYENSEKVRERVIKARNIQLKRFEGLGIYTNSQMSHKLTEKFCPLNPGGQSLLKIAMEKYMLSIRVYDKVLKIARTIADLNGEENIRDFHISEALQYRVLDRILNLIV